MPPASSRRFLLHAILASIVVSPAAMAGVMLFSSALPAEAPIAFYAGEDAASAYVHTVVRRDALSMETRIVPPAGATAIADEIGILKNFGRADVHVVVEGFVVGSATVRVCGAAQEDGPVWRLTLRPSGYCKISATATGSDARVVLHARVVPG